MRDYNELIEHGSKAQIEKILDPKNVDKGDFSISLEYGLKRALDEWIELKTEIESFSGSSLEYYNRIRLEAADLANFAHMIIMHCDNEIEKIKDGEAAAAEVY